MIKTKSTSLILLLSIILPTQSIARSGFLYSFNFAYTSLATATEINITTTPTPSSNDGIVTANRDETFDETGINVGYLYKRRRTSDFFLLPEFYYTTFDDDAIYGTNFKFGPVIGNLNIYANIGVTKIPQFKQNKVHTGLGLHYRINKNYFVSFEWMKLDEFTEETEADTTFGAQTITNSTNTERKIEMLGLGFTLLY